MALERVEVAERGRAEDRGAEGEVIGVEDGVVLRGTAPGGEAVDEIGQGLHAQAARQVVVERRHALAVQHAVVGEVGIGRDRSTAGHLEVDPSGFGIERRRQAPFGSCGGVSFADVGETHRPQSSDWRDGPGSSP